MHRFFALTASLALAATPAAAAVFAVDGGFGATSATRSTANGFDVLDLDITRGNVAVIDAELAPGGLFEGWRRATTGEIVAFWSDAGVDVTGVGEPIVETSDPAQVAAVRALQALVGFTALNPTLDESEGFTAEPAPDAGEWTAAILWSRYDRDLEQFTSAAAVTGLFRDAELVVSSDNIGNWLVRDFAVPAPAMLGLFGLGTLGLALRRR